MYPKEKSERAEKARAAARKQIADQLLELCDNGHAAAVERGYLSMKAVPPPFRSTDLLNVSCFDIAVARALSLSPALSLARALSL